MPTAPTAITPLPTAPSRADPANFPTRADAFLAALPTFGSQLNANASAAYTNASDSVTAANNAAASETNAAASAIAAAASALTALNAPGTSGTSTTSLTIGTGSQTFTTQTGKAWVVGQFVTVASTASPTNFMHGQITAYNSGTGSMTVNVLAVGGSGTLASWTIGLVGPNATLTDQNSLQPVALTLPSIRPSLLLDFANSKKLDPRITFSRATSATYYDGVTTAKAEENLLLRSQDFSATWTLANLTAGSAVTAPDGTATGSSFTASAANGTLTQSVTAIAAEYTFSVYLRRVTGTGDIDITAHSGGTWVTQSITSSWARYTVTQTLTAGSRTPGIRIVTSGDQIEVWGAQLEQRSAATAYTPTTTQPITNYVPQLLTAPAGVPRFDHNPTTGESLGLLIEEQRTNLLTYSEEFDNAAWQKNALTVSSNATTAPDGSLTADAVIEQVTNTYHTVNRSFTPTASTNYSLSIYAKANGRNICYVRADYVTNNIWTGAVFDLSNESATVVQGSGGGYTGTTASISSVGNGWYRCVVTYRTQATTTGFNPFFGVSDGTAPGNSDGVARYAGDPTKGIYIWGAQLEAGTFPTSYIPTTSASVTRTVDAPRMTGTNFSSWFNQNEWTVVIKAKVAHTEQGRAFEVTYGTSTADIASVVTRSTQNLLVGGGGVTATTLNAGTIQRNVPFSLATAYKTNDFAACLNGGAVATSSTGYLPAVFNQVTFYSQFGVREIGGTLSKLAYYPERLTNAQLQALTA